MKMKLLLTKIRDSKVTEEFFSWILTGCVVYLFWEVGKILFKLY